MSQASETTGGRSSAADHIQLMRQMGASAYEGFNPIAPRSHRWMMDVSQLEEIRVFGWALWRTIDRDPQGQTGPQKKKRTFFAQDVRGQLGVKHLAEDLGMTLANASDALKRTVEKERIRIDEKERICPRGDTPEPRRIKSKDDSDEEEDDVFCTEKLPEPLVLSFQSLDIKRRAQYMRRYLGMPQQHSEHFKKLDPEQRSFHTWRYLQALEYDEQLAADAIAAARAKGQEIVDGVLAEAGYQDQESRGRPKVSRELTIDLQVRVEPDTFFVQKTGTALNGDSVQKSYKNQNGSVQKSASLLTSHSSHSSQRVSENSGNVENPAPEQKKVAAHPTPRSTALGLNPTPPPTPPKLPVEHQNAAHANAAVETFEALIGRTLPAKDPLRREIAKLGSDHDLPQTTICRFMKEKHAELANRKFQLDNPGAFRDILKQDLPLWLRKQRAEIVERERKADAAFRGPAEPFDPLTYPAKLAELKGMTAKKATS